MFYLLRPHILDEIDRELKYEWFGQIITRYENEHGDIPGLYRDNRGVLYHPHLHEEIPLGTMMVEKYRRPKWKFNKILYCEKEGFFPILKDVKWPERHDCALLTSKGHASRAAKDIIDFLGETDEEILFYCIHDADAAGTMIYQALQEGTAARKERKVKVHNLGLESWEAIKEIGLEPEGFSKKKLPVADYVIKYDDENDGEWADWLQSNRVELNAMTTPQFLNWLDNKMAKFGKGKLIPPDAVMENKLKESAISKIRDKVEEKILREAGYEDQVKETTERLIPVLEEESGTLREVVTQDLEKTPENQWSKPVDQVAEEIVNRFI